MNETPNGIIFTNLVDYDMVYGHRNNAIGYAKALEAFDQRLPEILSAARDEDIIFITADHGCDPTTESTDHSREYVPLIVWGKNIKKGVNLGIRQTFADLGKTVAEYLELKNNLPGESFLGNIIGG
ncbi:Phosphopentomutase [bioreactor metagenome]|uniref:Phosphopentomutase n=1 Tax=bioreactor metagenome TaxID=1076179 RepID=A0A645HUJ3_9ZZZZ